MDSKWSPDASLVSFVRNNNMWLLDVRTNQQIQLTNANNANGAMCGVAEYIMQEEFHRYTGYWWAPVVINQDNKRWRTHFVFSFACFVWRFNLNQHNNQNLSYLVL